jgi:hypothetical protein
MQIFMYLFILKGPGQRKVAWSKKKTNDPFFFNNLMSDLFLEGPISEDQ